MFATNVSMARTAKACHHVKEGQAEKNVLLKMHTNTVLAKRNTTYMLKQAILNKKKNTCHFTYWHFLPAEVLRGRTGSGSEAPSTLGVKPGTTAVAVLISRSRLLTP